MPWAVASGVPVLLAVVLLLAANAFFVAAEFALVKVRAIRLEALAAAGSGRARLATKILKHLEAYLAACQLGITMASLGLGWVGEPAVAACSSPCSGFGLSDAVLHTVAFLTGFLIFLAAHRDRRAGAQDPGDPAAGADQRLGGRAAARLLPPVLAAQLGPEHRLARLPALLGVAEASVHEVFRRELRQLIGVSRQVGEVRRSTTCWVRCSTSRSSRSAR